MSSNKPYGDPQTRNKILDVAVSLAAELGPSMRLADVSKAAGISHQGLYLHFPGRDALLAAMPEYMVETFDIHRRHQAIVGAEDGATALVRMVEFLGFMNEQLDAIGWVLEEVQHLDEAFGRDWRQRVSGLREAIRHDVIERLASENTLRPGWTVDDATDLFLAITTLGTWRELTRGLGWTAAQYTEHATRLIETSLLMRNPT